MAIYSVSESRSTAPSTVHDQEPQDLYLPTPNQSHSPMTLMFLLPPYIRPLPPGILTEDLVLLADRGAFDLPHTTLRNQLLREYSNYVHPLLPILNLPQFLQAIFSEKSDSQLSLMLFYTVMATATSFTEPHILQEAGYSDRPSARRALFQKAKVRIPNLCSAGLTS